MSIVQPRTMDLLTLAAAKMARAAPQSWAEFVKTLEAVAAERASACIQAPSDQVFMAQGMARQVAELHALFADAVARATRLEDKLKEKPHGR